MSKRSLVLFALAVAVVVAVFVPVVRALLIAGAFIGGLYLGWVALMTGLEKAAIALADAVFPAERRSELTAAVGTGLGVAIILVVLSLP